MMDAETSATDGFRFVLDTATVTLPEVWTSAMDTEPYHTREVVTVRSSVQKRFGYHRRRRMQSHFSRQGGPVGLGAGGRGGGGTLQAHCSHENLPVGSH